jgi:hypothetical protein
MPDAVIHGGRWRDDEPQIDTLSRHLNTLHPQLRLHLSVQGSATSCEAINFYHRHFDIRRAVLPRVLSVAQVEQVVRNTPVEIEVFGYGSLCVMVEGRGALSSYVTGDSPNTTGVCSPAAAVQIGTPFAVTEEGDAHQSFKQVLAEARPEDIVTFMSVAGLPARAVLTPWLRDYLRRESALRAHAKAGPAALRAGHQLFSSARNKRRGWGLVWADEGVRLHLVERQAAPTQAGPRPHRRAFTRDERA